MSVTTAYNNENMNSLFVEVSSCSCSPSEHGDTMQVNRNSYRNTRLSVNLQRDLEVKEGEGGYTCQHGPKECQDNIIENCVLRRLQDPKTQVDYVNCAFYDPDQPGLIGVLCVTQSGLDILDIHKCSTSEEGYMLMLRADTKTKTMTPGPLYVPTIVFDDKYNDEDQNNAIKNFELTLCNKRTWIFRSMFTRCDHKSRILLNYLLYYTYDNTIDYYYIRVYNLDKKIDFVHH